MFIVTPCIFILFIYLNYQKSFFPNIYTIIFFSHKFKGIESLQPQTDFLIPISLQPNVVNLSYFKLCILLDKII